MQNLHNSYTGLMITPQQAVRAYFAKLGLETEIADLYLALREHGPQTISELSRSSGVERTRIYRLIDSLLSSNLIEMNAQSRRGVIRAAPIANLHILIQQREQELKSLQDELGLIEQVLARNSLSSPAMRVQLFHGPAGIRQMLRHELDAKTEVIGYEYRPLDAFVGRKFMEDLAAEYTAKKIVHRLVAADRLEATHNCHIYDDVVAYFQWRDGQIYGTELYSPDTATVQRQLLDQFTLEKA